MRAGGCGVVRRQLSAYRDGELPVADQIAVESHVRSCRSCAEEVADFEVLGKLLCRAMGPDPDEQRLAGLASNVVSRLKAERDQSLSGWTERTFQDMHLVWAALGATGATVACLAIVFGIFYFSTHQRPDSLRGMIATLSLPEGSNENPYQVDARILLPRPADGDAFPEAALRDEDESVFALAAVLTREGRIANLELLHSEARRGDVRSAQQEQEIVSLLDTFSKARFKPARYGNAPVAVNMVWLHTQLTVRGKMPENGRPVSRLVSPEARASSLAA
ncbi:MAG TPA: zf-HC2 domain-containing protein [Vicinamibacterales bacterium]|nr:zf-HC2 domain-containing protein [Vicinamibacterales bacterium]